MNEKLLTIKQFAEKNQQLDRWPKTESAIRAVYRRQNKNNMATAFRKISGTILVDEDEFYKNN